MREERNLESAILWATKKKDELDKKDSDLLFTLYQA